MTWTVARIIEEIRFIAQCSNCGTLNYRHNACCWSCKKWRGFFNDQGWDREQEVEILKETYSMDTKLFI